MLCSPHAPPLFIAVGATHFNVTNGCLALFAAWKAASTPVELHIYDGVSAGFGLESRGRPVMAGSTAPTSGWSHVN